MIRGLLLFALLALPSLAQAQTRSTVEIIYRTDCAIVTPASIGEICIETDNPVNTMWISTGASLGQLASIMTDADNAFGHIHLSTDNAVLTTLSANNIFVKAAGTCFQHSSLMFTESAECTLRYDGDIPEVFTINISLSVTKAAGSATTGYFRVAKNGDPNSELAFGMQSVRSLSNTSDSGNVSITAVYSLSQNDTVDLWVATADSDNITIDTMSMTVEER